MSLVLLACFLCSAAYVVFGILHMLAPKATLRLYRLFLGTATWQRVEPSFSAMTQRSWKLLGAFNITIGLTLVYLTMRSTERLFSLH